MVVSGQYRKQTCHYLGMTDLEHKCNFQLLIEDSGSSLSDESLQILLDEVKAIINSSPLTTGVLNDVTSIIAPPSPVNLPTMRSKVALTPLGNFMSPDQYCRKHW